MKRKTFAIPARLSRLDNDEAELNEPKLALYKGVEESKMAEKKISIHRKSETVEYEDVSGRGGEKIINSKN